MAVGALSIGPVGFGDPGALFGTVPLGSRIFRAVPLESRVFSVVPPLGSRRLSQKEKRNAPVAV